MKRIWMGLIGLLFSITLLSAQGVEEQEKGFEVGIFQVRPEAEALGAYDDRVALDAAGNVDGDAYAEASAALYINNTDARYDLSAKALIGYRFYEKYTGLDNDFYDAAAAISSAQDPLKLGLSAHLRKSLDYDTFVEGGNGDDLAAILTRDPSSRFSTQANLGYEKQLSDKMTITPGYDFWYYFQDFETRADAEWVVHRGSLELGYGYTKKTLFTLSGYYSLQANENEDGNIGTVAIGARSRATDKTQWLAEIGVAAADYELSGSGQSVVSRLRATWQATEKISTYVAGGNNFQPGSGNRGAQLVYRLGYGADWRVLSRWHLKAQVLHDYTEAVVDQGSANSDDVKHFFSAITTYDLTRSIALSLSGRYIKDELDVDQTIVSLGVAYRY